MSIRVWALAWIAMAADPGWSQVTPWDRFYPLDVGNRWAVLEFAKHPFGRYSDLTVVGDTLIDGETWAIVDGGWLDRHYRPIEGVRCAVRLVPCCGGAGVDFDYQVLAGASLGCLPEHVTGYNADLIGVANPGTVQIGGVDYDVDELLWVDHTLVMIQSGASSFAADIGFISGWSAGAHGGATYFSDLVFADVASGTYGREPHFFDPPDWRRLYPLAVGDRWVYAEARSLWAWQEFWVQRTVVGDTVIGGVPHHVIHELTVDRDGTTLSEARCGVRLTDAGWFQWVSIDGSCTPLEATWPGQTWWRPLTDSIQVTPLDSFQVGNSSYPALAQFVIGSRGGGFPGYFHQAVFLTDIGLYWWEYDQPTGHRARFLVHARINGIEYGSNPVAGEGGPERSRPTLEASPNPVQRALSVSFETVRVADARIEVFDALGRRIHAKPLGVQPSGRHTVELDASSWSPGVYLLRLEAGEHLATAVVTRSR